MIAPASVELSVAIVGICGARHLAGCLAALHAQTGGVTFEIVVAFDPALEGSALEALRAEYPAVRMVGNRGQRTPLELASRAIEESRGTVLLLTEDHCVPHADWVSALSGALRPEDGAVGGVVELAPGARAVDWAFYFVDFFRYADPARGGPAPSLTVCNVAYRRQDLERQHDRWIRGFHETAVNERLRDTCGPLRLVPHARVTMHRHVGFRDAVRERYAFGRLFGATRLASTSRAMRMIYRAGAPLLPAVLLTRLVAKAVQSADSRRHLRRGWAVLVALVLAWSWGEWLGYLTGRVPGRLTVAEDRPGGFEPERHAS